MGDEKAPDLPRVKKADKPPMPTTQPAPKDQHAGPAKATEQKPPAGGEQTPHQATPAGQSAALQHSVGNQQANRLMRAAREPDKDPHTPAGVKVSHPDDAHEKEAEAVAKHVTSGADPTHSHGTAAKTAPSGGAPGDPPKIAGDPDLTHRAIAPHTASAQPHPDAPQHGAATQHPATQVAATQHPSPAGPNPATVLDHPGPGQPIPQPTRGILEARLKADLSHVVVHHDAAADQAVRALHARAVTRGNHIFLASDASPTDLSLMAHEVTHVLHHQGGVVHRQTDNTPAAPGNQEDSTPKKYYTSNEGSVDIVETKDPQDENENPRRTIEIAKIPYADAKKTYLKAVVDAEFAAGTQVVPPERGETDQTAEWRKGIGTPTAITKAIEDLLPETTTIPAPKKGEESKNRGRGALFLLRFGTGGTSTESPDTRALNGIIVGTKDGLIKTAQLPYWDRHRQFNPMNVDHLAEIQVGGIDRFENFWLWEAVANKHGGRLLQAAISNQVKTLLENATEKHKDDPQAFPLPPNRGDEFKDSEWRIKIRSLGGGLGPLRGNPDVHWTADEVKNAEPVKKLSAVGFVEARDLGFGRDKLAGYLTIVLDPDRRGALVQVNWDATKNEAIGDDFDTAFKEVYPHFDVTKVTFDAATGQGEVVGNVHNKGDVEETKELTLRLSKFPGKPTSGLPFAKLSGQVLASDVGFFHYKKLSPITISQAEMVTYAGFSARGTLQPSIPILRNNPIDVVFDGGDISFEKTFDAKSLPLPAPLKVTSGGITVSAGTDGFQVGGTLSLSLGTVATGNISATVDSKQNFTLDGQLDFDKTLFQPASLGFTYRKSGSSDYSWGINGALGIPANKIPGIKSALVNVSYTNSKFALDGHADLAIPGLQSGSLAITYADQTGLTIGGSVAFAPSAFIESGSLDATVTKQAPANHWSVAAHGTVKPKIPGINTTLNASYNDGIYTIEGTVAYARGMLSGSLTVGLTNQPLGSDGRPDAGPPKAGSPKGGGAPHASGSLRPYGSGTLTAKITPWLQGTAGVQIQTDGSVQLMGEIKLPDSINLFNAIEVQKNILNVGIKIPIVGVSVLGQSIGIFADVSGGLDASAGVGPGQLNGLGLKVQYNPEHEDQTQITGTAHLDIPAHAGLRLYVNGGIGAGIPVVSAEAGLQITGQLGLQSVVQAGVTVNWTPKKGLVIDAQASLTASPTFTFGINGYVKVTADLWFDTVNLYEKHWQLASVQYGSGLQIGVTAPIHYEEGKPFSFSPSDVKFQLPNIDPTKILSDLVHNIV